MPCTWYALFALEVGGTELSNTVLTRGWMGDLHAHRQLCTGMMKLQCNSFFE